MMATLNDVIGACTELLKYLSVKDTCKVASCSKAFRTLSKEEIKHRSVQWKAQTSRAWAYDDNTLPWFSAMGEGGYVPADNLPIDDKRALNCLDSYWKSLGTPACLLDEVAVLCGGWPRLLHAREAGAKHQPIISRGMDVEGFTTLGDEPCPKVLMFDIYCDEKAVWSAVLPIDTDESDSGYAFYPSSFKTLGDKIDDSTIFPDSPNDANRPPRYLLSTDVNDMRSWKFNVSLVTPKSFETLILSISMEPKEMVHTINRSHLFYYDSDNDSDYSGECAWEKDSGYEEMKRCKELRKQALSAGEFGHLKDSQKYEFLQYMQKRFDSFAPNENLWRCSDCEDVTELTTAPGPRGIDEDDNIIQIDGVKYHFCYWLDRRNQEKVRFHLIMDFEPGDSLWSDMILNARKSPFGQLEHAAKRCRYEKNIDL